MRKYYACTSCHHIEQEDPDLRFSDPEARLPYVKQKGLPFLQGTTFKGIVNRETWYNDDYIRKYGDEKIEVAHESLRESIQLCAVECSQGREMEMIINHRFGRFNEGFNELFGLDQANIRIGLDYGRRY